ncbi:envelope stress response membrane protein PspB [Tatumella sp. TA1]|uniref:envelope stress response membrane protein PspB n=1 Tax=Rosenbergiella collisarenosi TaxID=1544695 RepID=UPI0008F912C4|nr:envelope stress response membrane protein PspB [Rosenbergiella collisarenosi]MBT0720797.1 envelope stress response membrane protein PspB [Rosenbergiella collisarenosi]QGX91435.1 envelope stress response membrane protein PspB [Tatumella sp. TA1]
MSGFLLSIPLTLFIVFIAPLWLWLHYSQRGKLSNKLSAKEIMQIEQLKQEADRMQNRITALEAILDAENPEWRQS